MLSDRRRSFIQAILPVAAASLLILNQAVLAVPSAVAASLSSPPAAPENSNYMSLPFTQDWSDTSQITDNDVWTNVNGIVGYLGDDPSTTATGMDPQTVLVFGSGTVDVIANGVNPNTLTTGGVAEFDTLFNPVVALQGSGTADAPFLLFYVDTSGYSDITVSYNLRDIDGSTDNAIQPLALQYRIGESGDFTNVPAGFVADATSGPSLATMVTPVSAVLPADANDQAMVQIRVITTNAVGSDEWVGIDDISITGSLPQPHLSITKSVTSDSLVSYHGVVTYTIDVQNAGDVDAENVVVSDTLPAEVDFDSWVSQPTGAEVILDSLGWTGTVAAQDAVTFVFKANHVGNYGDTVVNTAEYTHDSGNSSDSATFTVQSDQAQVTFVYHDLEDVVHPGESVYLAGEFNGWDPTGFLMDANAGATTFTQTLILSAGTYAYKYIVYDGSTQWDWLNTNNRSIEALADSTRDDYRNVTIGWGNLVWPATTSVAMGGTSENIYGRAYIQNVTNPAGEGRGLKAEVGYGSGDDPGTWTWFPMGFITDDGNNDEFVGTVTPVNFGLYKYAVRFDGNSGVGNPNAAWTYASLNGVPFDPQQSGAITVTPASPVLINEADSDNPGTDTAEFIELYDGGVGNTPLDGLVVVLYNGSNDQTYAPVFDLDGYSTDASGFFVIGGNGIENPDILYTTDSWLQNGADAVALYLGDASSFPANTPLTTNFLLDALVYGTADPDDVGLLALLNAGQPQIDEASGGDATLVSNQRCPDGFGGGRNTESFIQASPTAGGANACQVTLEKTAPALVPPGATFTYTLTVNNSTGFALTNLVISDVLPAGVTYLSGGSLTDGAVTWSFPSLLSPGTQRADLVVQAPADPAVVYNQSYRLSADNLAVPVAGKPVMTVVDTSLHIHHIQGAAQLSPFAGQAVQDIHGIVTAVSGTGFYMQDPQPDTDEATSEGIFVYVTSGQPAVGDEVLVSGNVQEYYSGGYATGNLPTTELSGVTVVVQTNGNPLPAATVIGVGGRVPPQQVIEDDTTDGNVETSGVFDPATDTIDFYESLEGMLVQVNEAVSVGPTNSYGEIAVVGDGGVNAGTFTPRGGLIIQPNDYNPERIIVEDTLVASPPAVSAGTSFTAPIIGVMDYSFGNFKLYNLASLSVAPSPLISETTAITRTAQQITVAAFNVENLNPLDPPGKFASLANEVVVHLGAPDILAVEEIQDNDGETDNGTTDASLTYAALIAAIQAAGGPTYAYRDISPLDNQDGGAPGGNIRVGFLFRSDRGVSFLDRPGGDATTATTVTNGPNGIELSSSPGRIDPTNPAFLDSRKPLAGEFEVNGAKLVVIANHFNSKGGDNPLFGRYQPPVLSSEVQRLQQAQVVNDFVDSILALDPYANVVVLGDLNDFQFSPPLLTLMDGVLSDLINTLDAAERYTYVYDGNSQALDHLLVSDNLLLRGELLFDVVHINAEFPAAINVSDHDPVLARLTVLPWGHADFSDAFTSYGLAWHMSPHLFWLGENVTDDLNANPGNDSPSNDGVFRTLGLWQPGNVVTLTVQISGTQSTFTGSLAGWFDWNRDGNYTPDEEAFVANVAIGSNTIAFQIPLNAHVGTGDAATIQARFRLFGPFQKLDAAIQNGFSPTGLAYGGEVEDYLWSFGPTAIRLQNFSARTDLASTLLVPIGMLMLLSLALIRWLPRRSRP